MVERGMNAMQHDIMASGPVRDVPLMKRELICGYEEEYEYVQLPFVLLSLSRTAQTIKSLEAVFRIIAKLYYE